MAHEWENGADDRPMHRASEDPEPPFHEGGDAKSAASFALPRPSRTLTALTTSALALPGIAGSVRAETPIERASASSAFSYYKEDDLPSGKFAGAGNGSRERYEVFTGQLRFDVPLTERTDLGVDFLYEKMSGASPWFVQADSVTNEPVQVMSGATIEDQRFDLSLDVDFFMDRGKDTLSGGFSKENDYLSINFGLAAERNLNEKNTTVSAAGAFSYDWIDPTDADLFTTRPAHKKKWSVDLFAGLSQIFSRASTGQFTINYKHSDGYLSDPYKAIRGIGPGDPLLPDRRPGKKDQVSLLFRYRHHFESLNGSLHADYRFYADDWEMKSHTVDLAWYQDFLGLGWLTITPSVRWYSQSKAFFYDPLLPAGTDPKTASSDYRLSPYGAISYRLKVEAEFVNLWNYDAPAWLQAVGISEGFDLIASVSYERYLSDGRFSAISVDDDEEAPALVRFNVFAVTLTGRF